MTEKYAPIVQLDKGLVRGIAQQVDRSEIYLYQGLRYGKANRFEKAQPVDPWTGVYEVTSLGVNPPQSGLEIAHKGYFTQAYSEDCLLLNVWKPIRESSRARSLRPVMVYIFGGRFQTGSIFKITHDGRWIAHRGDVIVVAMNYRVGPFGFMYGHDEAMPANLGLHDVILALAWIQQNITKFEGDPNCVTLFGNSTGSVMVGALILSPLTKGLFHRATLQSGHPLLIPHKEEKLSINKAIAQYLNCDSSDMREVSKALKAKSVEELLQASKSLDKSGKDFTLSIFNVVYGDEVLPLRPVDVAVNGHYNTDIDLLYGTVRDEGAGFVFERFPQLKGTQIELTVDTTREFIVELIGEFYDGHLVGDFYLNKSGLNDQSSDQDDFRAVLRQVFGDMYMTAGVILFGENHAKFCTKRGRKVFAYQLVQPPDFHTMALHSCTKSGEVCHGDELFYLFSISRQTTPQDDKLSHEFIQTWTKFAKNGDTGTVDGEQWTPAVESDDFTTKFMALGYNSKMVINAHKELCQFWKNKLIV